MADDKYFYEIIFRNAKETQINDVIKEANKLLKKNINFSGHFTTIELDKYNSKETRVNLYFDKLTFKQDIINSIYDIGNKKQVYISIVPKTI